jgi:hypothetical protein
MMMEGLPFDRGRDGIIERFLLKNLYFMMFDRGPIGMIEWFLSFEDLFFSRPCHVDGVTPWREGEAK